MFEHYAENFALPPDLRRYRTNSQLYFQHWGSEGFNRSWDYNLMGTQQILDPDNAPLTQPLVLSEALPNTINDTSLIADPQLNVPVSLEGPVSTANSTANSEAPANEILAETPTQPRFIRRPFIYKKRSPESSTGNESSKVNRVSKSRMGRARKKLGRNASPSKNTEQDDHAYWMAAHLQHPYCQRPNGVPQGELMGWGERCHIAPPHFHDPRFLSPGPNPIPNPGQLARPYFDTCMRPYHSNHQEIYPGNRPVGQFTELTSRVLPDYSFPRQAPHHVEVQSQEFFHLDPAYQQGFVVSEANTPAQYLVPRPAPPSLPLRRSVGFDHQRSANSNLWKNQPAYQQSSQPVDIYCPNNNICRPIKDQAWAKCETSTKQQSNLLTPNSLCGSPLSTAAKDIKIKEENDCGGKKNDVTPPMDSTANIVEDLCRQGQDTEETSTDCTSKAKQSSGESKGEEGPEPDEASTDSLNSQVEGETPRTQEDNIEFDFEKYGLTGVQADAFRNIFHKQLDILYRSVTEEFNGKYVSLNIGIELVLGYLHKMKPSEFKVKEI